MTVYVVIIEDRHVDVDVTVFLERENAIRFARDEALDRCKRPEDYEEQNLMLPYVYFATYSVEGDSVSVVPEEIQDA